MSDLDNLTVDQIRKTPDVYLDFLLALRPVVESAQDPIKVSAIPRGEITTLLRSKGHPQDTKSIGEVLERKGLVNSDRLGFYWPTATGTIWIRKLVGQFEPAGLPEFPNTF